MLRTLLVACLLALSGAAFAAYPERPIKVFLPFPPGGTVDVVARLVWGSDRPHVDMNERLMPNDGDLADHPAALFGFQFLTAMKCSRPSPASRTAAIPS